jgi:hypothetical protein
MKKSSLLLLCIAFLTLTAPAQEVKFGKVTKEELLEKSHPLEPDAKAAVLYKDQKVRFDYNASTGWTLVTTVFQRIKIYQKTGFDWATTLVPLYIGSSETERISGVKGVTFNYENNQITEDKLKKESIFEEKVNKYRKKASITHPNVKEGSVLDLEYQVFSPFFTSIDELKYQFDIPVNQINTVVSIPEYFMFKQHFKGFYRVKFDQHTENQTLFIDGDRLSYLETIYNISGQQIPSMQDESYVSNIDNYRTSVKFELNGTRFPGNPYKMYNQTWEDVAKTIYKYDSFGEQLDKQSYFKDDLAQLITNEMSPEEKAARIFAFVQNKMAWNNYYGSTCNDGVIKAYKENTGNVAEINLMLTAMLRAAGLDANPVLVSTRSNGIPLFPTIEGFDYVVSTVNIDGNTILFDATEKETIPNLLPIRALNWNGTLVRKDGTYSTIDLSPNRPSNKSILMNASLDEKGGINGKLQIYQTDYVAYLYRRNLKSKEKEAYLESLENKYNGIEISDYQTKDAENPTKPVTETFAFQKEDQCEIIDGKIYFSPLFFFATNENPFKMETREYPIDFAFPISESYRFNISLPEGLQVESLPENVLYKLPDNLGELRFSLAVTGNMLQVNVVEKINSAVISPINYLDIKEFYNQLVQKETEKVVLTKI